MIINVTEWNRRKRRENILMSGGGSPDITRGTSALADDKDLVSWHSHLQTFLMFFVDATSSIDIEDLNWTIYLLCEQYNDRHTSQ